MDVLYRQLAVEPMVKMARMTSDEVVGELQRIDPRWELRTDEVLTRTFVFQNFVEAMAFVNDVADEAEKANHHPKICIFDYRKVKIELTTHAVDGLSEMDFALAMAIDTVAKAR